MGRLIDADNLQFNGQNYNKSQNVLCMNVELEVSIARLVLRKRQSRS